MKAIKQFSLILTLTIIIAMQINATDQPQQSKTEEIQPSTNIAASKITDLQKKLDNATNQAAKEIVEAMLIRDEKDQIESIKTKQENIIKTTKEKLITTYDTIKKQIDEEQKNTSYFSQFISKAKTLGKYIPFLLPMPPEFISGYQYIA